MATETNKTNILRLVNHDANPTTKATTQTGILFERVSETQCPQCHAVVPLTNLTPLSVTPCPSCGAKVTVPGRVGGFYLYDRIGEGEMGTIYRATDESLKRDVAIKLVRGCRADDTESCERLRQEACAAGKLNHPRVAQVHALNFSNGHPYLVMELVSGEDFSQKLKNEGPLDERTVLNMALDVAEGLSALNREGLVHGDIKPGNIVLDRDGHAKLVDFGLAGMARRDGKGTLVGTPDYIAPELLRGAPDSHRSDLYSLGATLYHLLAGRPPHDGETPSDVLRSRMTAPAVPLEKVASNVSFTTQKLVMQMLERSPEKRPANSDAIAAEVRNALAYLDASANAPSSRTKTHLLPHHRLATAALPSIAAIPHRRLFVLSGTALFIAALSVLFAVKSHMLQQFAGCGPLAAPTNAPTAAAAPPLSAVQPKNDADVFTVESNPVWGSINLGARARGNTLQAGTTLMIQGTGENMSKGVDNGRFVWTQVSGDYALCAQVRTMTASDRNAVSGLLIKDDLSAQSPGLLFGFLGSGQLLLQGRYGALKTPPPTGFWTFGGRLSKKTATVKRSDKGISLPVHLKLVRHGSTYDAFTSQDGENWTLFASCEADFSPTNVIGFAVSSQDPDALATAKFASVRLLTTTVPTIAATNGATAEAGL